MRQVFREGGRTCRARDRAWRSRGRGPDGCVRPTKPGRPRTVAGPQRRQRDGRCVPRACASGRSQQRRQDSGIALTVDHRGEHRPGNSARWTVALALELRQSEALALQWKDFDLLANTLTVRRSIHRVRGGGLIYEEPKTRRSQRTLALPLSLVAELHRHRSAQLGERMLAGFEWHDEDLVFAQANGRPIDKKPDYDDWTRLLKAAGVRPVRLHDGRHTAATLLLSENVHPRVVMELLGHSQMRPTMDIYSHVMSALAREAADRMSAVLLPSEGANCNQLQPGTTQAAPPKGNGLVIGVELRGLEPLIPTLPGRHDRVHSGASPWASGCRSGDSPVPRTRANQPEPARIPLTATTIATTRAVFGHVPPTSQVGQSRPRRAGRVAPDRPPVGASVSHWGSPAGFEGDVDLDAGNSSGASGVIDCRRIRPLICTVITCAVGSESTVSRTLLHTVRAQCIGPSPLR
jgi:hypothetical protein